MTEANIGLPAADVVAQRIRTQRITPPGGGADVDQEVHTLAAPDGTLLDPGTLAKDASLVTAIARLTSILAALQATLTVQGTVTVTDGAGPLTVDATALPLPTGAAKDSTLTDGSQRIGGTVAVSGPVTDAQMRATPVPVSGTVTITDGSGPVTVDGNVGITGTPSVAVPGGVAVTAIPEVEVKNDVGNPLNVAAAALPLPTGAATSAKQDALQTALTDGTQKTQVTASALPAGAATSAKQDALAGIVATEATAAKRFGVAVGTPVKILTTAATSQTWAVYTPPAGKRIRLKWIYLSAPAANSTAVEATVWHGSVAIYRVSLDPGAVFAHAAVREDALADEVLNVETLGASAQTVYVNVDLETY